MSELDQLEYPRHLHKPNREFLVVQNAQEAASALKDGWTIVCPPPPDSPLGMAQAADESKAKKSKA